MARIWGNGEEWMGQFNWRRAIWAHEGAVAEFAPTWWVLICNG